MRYSNQNLTTVEGAGGFANYYRSQSTPTSIVSNLSSGTIYKNVNSRQSTNFEDRPFFSLFASNSTCHPPFSRPPVQISTSTRPDYSRGERYHQPVSILDGVTKWNNF